MSNETIFKILNKKIRAVRSSKLFFANFCLKDVECLENPCTNKFCFRGKSYDLGLYFEKMWIPNPSSKMDPNPAYG